MNFKQVPTIISEFKSFAMKGSVVDLAIGVIIGGAFGKIVTALVDQILMPPLGLLIGGMDFSQLKLVLKAPNQMGVGEVSIGYGIFIQNSVNFIIVAWALFMVIKAMNRIKRSDELKKEEAVKVVPVTDPTLKSTEEIQLQLLKDILETLKDNSKTKSEKKISIT
jgi:large conductance mechanosensitive channel